MTRQNIEDIYELAIPEIQQQADDITPHILAAAVEALKKSQDDEAGGKPKVSISHTVEIHLNTEPPSWKVKSAVSVRHVVESERQLLEDKNQMKLPFENILGPGDSVIISATGGVGTKISKDTAGNVSAEHVGGVEQ